MGAASSAQDAVRRIADVRRRIAETRQSIDEAAPAKPSAAAGDKGSQPSEEAANARISRQESEAARNHPDQVCSSNFLSSYSILPCVLASTLYDQSAETLVFKVDPRATLSR